MTDTITITAPDDWHIHLRDGHALKYTVPHAALSFERAIIMPNLVPPVVSAGQALAYRSRIEAEIPEGESFTPLMVLYLTDNTTAEEITAAKRAGVVACKLYPAGATTNSDSGVTDVKNIYSALEAMEKEEIALLLHGEVTASAIDIFDREKVFLDEVLEPLILRFPGLKIVLEHITTRDAVEFVAAEKDNLAATITAHHLLYNRNHMLAGGIRPHLYCLPILKRNIHQQALIQAAIGGNPKFFIGTDSAPHPTNKKEAACGCAGSYTAFAALPYYAQVFAEMEALDKLEQFTGHNGPDFYGLPRNSKTICLIKKPWRVPEYFEFGDGTLVPIMAGETLEWQVKKTQS